MRSSDAEAIALVHLKSRQASYRRITPERYLRELETGLAARETKWRISLERTKTEPIFDSVNSNGEIVGFIWGSPTNAPHFGNEYEIAGVYLLPTVWRRGIGRALVGQPARAILEMGHRSLLAWVLSDNPARGFFEHLGGERLGTDRRELSGVRPLETAYGWTDLPQLVQR